MASGSESNLLNLTNNTFCQNVFEIILSSSYSHMRQHKVPLAYNILVQILKNKNS